MEPILTLSIEIITLLLLLLLLLILTAIWLTPGGSSTVHIYTQTVHRLQRTEHT
jgi:hypothetical protein